MKKRGKRMERAVLVGVCLDDGKDMERTMDELKADAQKIRELHSDKFKNEFGTVGYFIF